MIAPGNRLLFLTAAVFVPAAGVAVLLPGAALIGAAVLVVFVLVAILDAAIGIRALDGLRVECQEVVRSSKDRDSELELTLHNESNRARQLRLGLPWPREITTPDPEIVAQLPADQPVSRLTWTFHPNKRGCFRIENCHVESPSPLGLWSVRNAFPQNTEIRVYPNLLSDRKNVAAIFLNRGGFGIHAQRQVGKGRDFEKLREYIPGDGYDEIHWKATAKRGHPVTKIFQIERTQEVYVVVDASRLSAREVPAPEDSAEPRVTTLERFITASLVLGMAAERQGDHFGLVTFSNQANSFIRARNGKAHYGACRDAIYTLEPQRVAPDFDELATFLRLRLRRRALLVFLTSLDDPVIAEQFTRSMELLNRQHLILVGMLPPPDVRPLFSDPDVSTVDDLYRHLGGHLRWRELRELEKRLRQRGVSLHLLEHERMTAQLVTQYLNVKRRQLI